MSRDFRQIEWDERTAEDCRALVRLAVREDLERDHDWTTLALVPAERIGSADIVARRAGIVAGLPAIAVAIDEMVACLSITSYADEGQRVEAGGVIARLEGNARDLLTCERTLLNLLGRMMGVATLASAYVSRIAGTRAHIYDTRKTTPAWRRLEKYAARCGGARNHRLGLYDAMLIKDNHLAQCAEAGQSPAETAAAAIRRGRQFLSEAIAAGGSQPEFILEIEVDSLDQLAAVLPERPDLVLLDNMSLDDLAAAVAMRDRMAPAVELEASGGVTLDKVRAIAETGVDRISVGAITHAAQWLDVGLDWNPPSLEGRG